MPSQNGNGGQGGPRSRRAASDSDIEDLVKQGQDRLKQMMPEGGPRGVIVRVRDLNKIQSEAYRQVEEIRGVADAEATEIYANAYNQSPEAVEFYEFSRTMQAYKSIIAENTTLVLSTGSDLFKFLKGMAPYGDVVPARRTADAR